MRFVLVLAIALVAPSAWAAIAFDAESDCGGEQVNPGASFSWTHTPSGTPKGAIVFVAHSEGNTDEVTSVTYGGTAMARITTGADTDGGEVGRAYVYFLGSSVPTGAVTVQVNLSDGSRNYTGAAMTLTAAGDTEVEDSGIEEDNQADPDVSLTTGAGVECFVAGGIHSGRNGASQISPGTDYTESYETGVGGNAKVHSYIRRTSNSTGGAVTVDWDTSGGSDDVGAVAVAVKESAVAAASPRMTLMGIGP